MRPVVRTSCGLSAGAAAGVATEVGRHADAASLVLGVGWRAFLDVPVRFALLGGLFLVSRGGRFALCQ